MNLLWLQMVNSWRGKTFQLITKHGGGTGVVVLV